MRGCNEKLSFTLCSLLLETRVRTQLGDAKKSFSSAVKMQMVIVIRRKGKLRANLPRFFRLLSLILIAAFHYRVDKEMRQNP